MTSERDPRLDKLLELPIEAVFSAFQIELRSPIGLMESCVDELTNKDATPADREWALETLKKSMAVVINCLDLARDYLGERKR
ncbi:MAG: hypothetical protein JNJ61_03210 [Anaerolineae bacterium]|nr:hypothetical protein [Anaerolineae bacterium]